jgi:hypothetical protein
VIGARLSSPKNEGSPSTLRTGTRTRPSERRTPSLRVGDQPLAADMASVESAPDRIGVGPLKYALFDIH